MCRNIGLIRKDLRRITAYLTEENYLVYLTTGEWIECPWAQIKMGVAYIKIFSGSENLEVRKKLNFGIDVSGNYKLLKKFDNIEQAKEYIKSLYKKS